MAVLESTSPKVPKGLTGDKFAQSLHKGNRSFFGMQTANIHISTVIPSIDLTCFVFGRCLLLYFKQAAQMNLISCKWFVYQYLDPWTSYIFVFSWT